MAISSSGTYVVFEGADHCGKSTLISETSNILASKNIQHGCYANPGATPLGQHLRKLTKYPEQFDQNIVIDPFSVQLLMIVDHINFISTILSPALLDNKVILADRSNYISCLVYGLAEGLDILSISKLLGLIRSPSPDRVYILQCDDVALSQRAKARDLLEHRDRFESHGGDFMSRVRTTYANLLSLGPEVLLLLAEYMQFENVKYLDSSVNTPQKLAEIVIHDIVAIQERKLEHQQD